MLSGCSDTHIGTTMPEKRATPIMKRFLDMFMSTVWRFEMPMEHTIPEAMPACVHNYRILKCLRYLSDRNITTMKRNVAGTILWEGLCHDFNKHTQLYTIIGRSMYLNSSSLSARSITVQVCSSVGLQAHSSSVSCAGRPRLLWVGLHILYPFPSWLYLIFRLSLRRGKLSVWLVPRGSTVHSIDARCLSAKANGSSLCGIRL